MDGSPVTEQQESIGPIQRHEFVKPGHFTDGELYQVEYGEADDQKTGDCLRIAKSLCHQASEFRSGVHSSDAVRTVRPKFFTS
jgi:hypothetical protein